jgi:hypothetical protein
VGTKQPPVESTILMSFDVTLWVIIMSFDVTRVKTEPEIWAEMHHLNDPRGPLCIYFSARTGKKQ